MTEIAFGVHDWTTLHERIGQPVHSHFLSEEGILIDPRVPEGGLEAIAALGEPAHALLTNRHHYRHAGELRDRFGITVWCHRSGMHEFDDDREVEPFEFGQELPGGFVALEVGALCPEETALWHAGRRVLALGDSVIEWDGNLGFVPDQFMGEDPDAVKEGLRASLTRLLERDFDHLLMAHGAPIADEGKARLAEFLEA